jgi:CheY-like chemotaxis protein
MRVLVIDDCSLNRELAQEQLRGHELVFASSYDEGQAALLPAIDQKKLEQRMSVLMSAAGFPGSTEDYRRTDRWDGYWTARQAARDQAISELTVHPCFDAVLTDLMMPPSEQALAKPHKFTGQEMPLGTFFVLLALRAGVRKVGLVTDTNHHDHPASAALDVFYPRNGAFDVGGTKVVCWNQGKSWAKVLELLNGAKPE